MKNRIVLVIIASLFLWSCASTMRHTWVKENYEGKHFENILVMGVTQNLEARLAFETTVVELLKKNGIKASNSFTLFPPGKTLNSLNEEQIENKIKSGNYDAVIVSSLINVNKQEVYERGTDSYYPVHYRYSRYIYSSYSYSYSPDYYRMQKSYVVGSRLFDTSASKKEDAIVWSGQSDITDPSSYESGAKQYATSLVKTLLKSNIIKRAN
jgi:hypothetical protein